jgi:voltage-gated potassium channel
MSFKDKVYNIIEGGTPHPGDPTVHPIGRKFDLFITTLIVINVALIVFESVEDLQAAYGSTFDLIEKTSVAVFVVEYLMRLYVSNHIKSEYSSRSQFVFSFYGIIDFLAIIPAFLGFTKLNADVLRQLRIFRLLRIFKLTRYNESMNMVYRVMKDKRNELYSTFFIALMLMIVVSSLMWAVEYPYNPSMKDIPTTLYWAVTTLTTVGYGDIAPVTGAGRLLFSFFALIGIAVVAIPSGIIASGFVDQMEKK